MVEPLYTIQQQCSLCETPYHSSKVRPKFKKAMSRDSDFCHYYEDERYNPEYYVVQVCPTCGYAHTENFEAKWNEAAKKQFFDKIAANWTFRDYGGERTWEDAMSAYKIALVCAQITQQSDRVIAGLLHHIAWLYRYRKQHEQEKRFLQFALDAYIRVYEIEGVSVNNAKLMYLLGELQRRLKNYNEAIRWFSRVVNDQKIMDAAMIAACREQWAVVREDMERDKLQAEA
ncbi:DUF2225 domain-containing protein [Marinicrinis sediminis]|uniref:DUF2225 domain-containing protein n=1 Tax=Marinicrinis sediminis TaxID=1652465 RepID=A0ABW5R8J7_9BACL